MSSIPETPQHNSLILFKDEFENKKYNHFDIAAKELMTKKFNKRERRLSFNRLTKFEAPRILGLREEQLRRGAHLTIPLSDRHYKPDGLFNYENIVIEELLLNTLPINIERYFIESGEYELWKLDELIKDIFFTKIKKYKKKLEKNIGHKISYNYKFKN